MTHTLPTISLGIGTGTPFGEAFRHARRIAQILQVRTEFTFNGLCVVVRADDAGRE